MSDSSTLERVSLERAIERLARAVARVEEASRSQRAVSAEPNMATADNTGQEMAALGSENEALRKDQTVVMHQLDGTIARLREVLDD